MIRPRTRGRDSHHYLRGGPQGHCPLKSTLNHPSPSVSHQTPQSLCVQPQALRFSSLSSGTSHCYWIESPLGFSLVQYFNQARSLTSSCEDYHNDFKCHGRAHGNSRTCPSLENGIQTGDVTWTEWQGQGQCSWGPTDTWLCAVSPPYAARHVAQEEDRGHTLSSAIPPILCAGEPNLWSSVFR